MKYHKWDRAGQDIYVCRECGMYRCHDLTDFTQIKHKHGKKRLLDVEYSDPEGGVIALNPTKQPGCLGA